MSQTRKRRVAAYARVSTDKDEQITSYKAQVDYYKKMIQSNEDWEYVDVYADEGITGTSTKSRKRFNEMVDDAVAGKIDLIITKSVSRFARNTVDTLVNMPLVIRHKWNVADSGYVETTGYNKGKAERHRLHRYILDVPEGMFIDHINGDRWDNRRKNLRFATPKDNAHNHRLAKNSTSGYKGVYFEKRRNKYCAHITVNRKKMHLGYFSDPKTAAMAYDRAAVLYFGEFASPNFR